MYMMVVREANTCIEPSVKSIHSFNRTELTQAVHAFHRQLGRMDLYDELTLQVSCEVTFV